MKNNIKSLAVIQENIGIDGRSKVVSEAVRALADETTAIDIFTLANKKSFERFVSHYNLSDYAVRHRQYLNSLPLPPGMTYRAVILNRLVRHNLSEYDLVFNSNNCLRFLPEEPPVISYVHEPLPAVPQIDTRYHASLLLRAYAFPMQVLHRLAGAPDINRHVVVTNSRFIANQFEDVFARQPDGVLYPPCIDEARKWEATGSGVVSLARFHPKKRQQMQLDVADRLPDVEFTIIGRVEPGRSREYYEECKRVVKRRGLNNVKLVANASSNQITDALNRSLVFLHSMKTEHFGISVVEGIQSGCVPVVHNSGGPREIVPVPELRYDSIKECTCIVDDCTRASFPDTTDRLSAQLYRFTKNQFETELKEYTENI